MEKEILSTKDIGVIKTTEPIWEMEIYRKLVDLEDRLRRRNLQILGIEEGPRESWEVLL